MRTLGILFPMHESPDGGIFKASLSTQDALRSDLIALLTLRRGQRVMQSRMFSPIYDYILEPMDSIMQTELKRKIKEKVNEFIPQIEIKEIKLTPVPEEHVLGIRIVYTIIDFFDLEETIELNVGTSNVN